MCQDWFEFKPKDLQLAISSSELPEYLGNVHAQNSQYRLPLAQADSNNIVDQMTWKICAPIVMYYMHSPSATLPDRFRTCTFERVTQYFV